MSRNALVVGINEYQHLPGLTAPVTDAEAIAQRLEQDSNFKVQRMPERIVTSADGVKKPVMFAAQPVTQRQLKTALKQLFLPESQQIPETALFYFSGHGLASDDGHDKGYLGTSDTVPRAPTPGLPLGWLHWLLSVSPVRQQIIWLDCCHSGSLIVNVDAANPGSAGDRHRCFIASSRDFESSWEDLNSPYSVLTKALLEGLNPNRLPDNRINSFDLVAHVSRALQGDLQTPVCTSFGEAIALTRRRQVAAEKKTETTQADNGICPYKGLEYFDCNDEDPKYFFGRERLVSQLIDHVRSKPFLALVGASGNGKSSVLRAGLLHQLKLGERVVGSEQWQIIITRPDAQPPKNLAAAFVPEAGSQLDRAEALGRAEGLLKEGSAGLQRLVKASSAPRTLLVIDQFEEVFTRCNSEAERLAYFECLMGAVAEVQEKLCLVIAMRADFVGKCLAQDYAGLAQQVQANMISVLPLAAEELRTAICKPAEQAGLSVDSDLVSAIIRDTKDAPGSLPLLQYTLKELWQRRTDGKLKNADYQQLGGIEGTLNQRATEVYNSFDATQQRTVQHIFQQLTQLGEGTEDTRRRVFLENLISEPLHPEKQVKAVVETLSSPENRLLVTSEVVSKSSAAERRAIVDVAHEALIRHWRLLQQWIEQNRDLLRQQRRIETSTIAWQEKAQARGYLLQGIPLIEAIQFKDKEAEVFPLSDAAKAFIHKSLWQRRWSRLKTASWLIIPAVLVVGVVEYNMRELSVLENYVQLEQEATLTETIAVKNLVRGCQKKDRVPIVPTYVKERLFGNCRPLTQVALTKARLDEANLRYTDFRGADLSYARLIAAQLEFAQLGPRVIVREEIRPTHYIKTRLTGANLTDANLTSADLSSADLRDTNLRDANLTDAHLTGADLSSADLINVNLTSADLFQTNLTSADLSFSNLNATNLSYTDLSYAILLVTDLHLAENLTQQQLIGEKPPFICNSPLPETIQIEGGMNRDCDRIAKVLTERYPEDFTLESAEKFVAEQRKRTWD